MRAIFAAIMMAVGLAGAGAAHGAATCQMQQLVELPVDVDGDITVAALVNGQPVKLAVDTGSAGTLLTYPAAARLGLVLSKFGTPGSDYGEVKMYGVGGSSVAAYARLKDFKVGDMTAHDFNMFVAGDHDFGDLQGVLGALFLMQTDVEFDFPDGKIRFFKPVNCKGDQVVYWGKAYSVTPMIGSTEGRIEVAVLLNGKTTSAQMDTGAATTVVTTAGAANAGVQVVPQGNSATSSLNGLGAHRVASYVGVFPTFSFGDETIRNARLRVADMFHYDTEAGMNTRIPTKVGPALNMLLGADFFRSHRVYVSLAQRKVYVSYAGGPVFAAPGASH
jgi:predicted aspartyl protease